MRRPRLMPVVGVAALALPVLEILGIIWVGRQIGAGWTLLLLVAGVVVGMALIQRAGQRTFAAMALSMRQGQMPAASLAQSGWIVMGGILFIIPGFITDVLGLLLMMPFVRRLFGHALVGKVSRNATWAPPTTPNQGDDAEPTVVHGDVL